MKPSKRSQGFTLIEVLIISATLLLLLLVLVPSVNRAKKARGTACAKNLREVALAFKVWVLDGNRYPAYVAVTNGGARESLEAGNVVFNFVVMSNELCGDPRLLVCPQDPGKNPAKTFRAPLSDTNVSYFVGMEADDTWPQVFMSGDRNLMSSNQPLSHGLFVLRSDTANAALAWTRKIHDSCGNIAFADGSVQFLNSSNLAVAAHNQGIGTNRLAIP